MAFWKSLKKNLRRALNGLLVTGMVFVTGFLSFTGMLVLYNSVHLAIASFFLAGGIEGEVYAQNINSSLLKIFTGDYWDEVILEQTLDKLIENSSNLEDSLFLNDFFKQRNLVHEMEEDERTTAEDLEKAQKHLAAMRLYFKNYIHQTDNEAESQNSENQPFHTELNGALKNLGFADNRAAREAIRAQIASKKFYSRLSWALIIGAGISCFFVGLAVAESSLSVLATYFGFAITGAALTTSIFSLAIVGAMGYMFLIHNTITDMLKNETLQEWGHKISDFFSRKSDEHNEQPESIAAYLARVLTGSIFVSLIVGLGIFATVATAGTWWYAAKEGAKLLPLFEKIASALASISVVLMATTTLVFNVVNSLRSLKELLKISLSQNYELAKKTFEKYAKLENFLQLINPFRLIATLISAPFKLAVFVGHLFSMGVMADNLEGVHPLVTAFIVTVNEACQDGHYFLPEDEDSHDEAEEAMSYDLQLMHYRPEKHSFKNTFVIFNEPARLYKYNQHGEAQEIFDGRELSHALAVLNLEDYLNDNPVPRSIKSELTREKLDILNDMIHSKFQRPTPGHTDQPAKQSHKHHHGHHHGHSHCHHNHDHHHAHPVPEQASPEKDVPKPHHHHSHDHSHHDHSHADLAGKFLSIVLFPLRCLVALWDWTASKFNTEERHSLSLGAAFSKALYGFVSIKPPIEAPNLSERWKDYEASQKAKETQTKEVPLSPNEQAELAALEEQLALNKQPKEETKPKRSWWSTASIDSSLKKANPGSGAPQLLSGSRTPEKRKVGFQSIALSNSFLNQLNDHSERDKARNTTTPPPSSAILARLL